jgi:hypothetical protein
MRGQNATEPEQDYNNIALFEVFNLLNNVVNGYRLLGGIMKSYLVRIPPDSEQRLHNISHESCCLHHRLAHILSQI